jgi:ribosomal protein S18 acetylase RimI-like enzyme
MPVMTAAPQSVLEAVRLRCAEAPALLEMLLELERAGETRHFAPHPFTLASLNALCEETRQDLHYVFKCGSVVMAYGLLRGWDEGFSTPSLGIAVRPGVRGLGYGAALMHFLHCAARAREVSRVRLRVHADNVAATGLYTRLGYEFESTLDAAGLRVAYKHLAP